MSTPKKVFVSYKYSDVVEGRKDEFNFRDKLKDLLGDNGLVHKGEDEESHDLGDYSEQQIISKIAPYVKKSSITVVLLTPNAKNSKWIPWELSMSLRERTYKEEQKMTRNGIIGVYLPLDESLYPSEDGSYDYYKEVKECGTTTHFTDKLPSMVQENTFNLKNGSYECDKGCCRKVYSSSEGSYIQLIQWSDFVSDMDKYIEYAWNRRNNFEEYECRIKLKDNEKF